MATHSSILAWEIPWTEEPGGLYSPRGHRELDMTNNGNKNQISEVNEFSTFLVGKCRIIPLTRSSALWDQHPVLSFPESPQGAPLGWLPRLRIWELQPVGLYPESPQAHPKERIEADTLTAETSFVCWYGKQHFSSHFKVASDSPHISKLITLRITDLGKIKFNWPHYSSDNLNSSYNIITTKPQCLFIILLVLGVCVLCVSRSVVSDALRPHGLYPSKLLCPWNSPGMNAGMGWVTHFNLGARILFSESWWIKHSFPS